MLVVSFVVGSVSGSGCGVPIGAVYLTPISNSLGWVDGIVCTGGVHVCCFGRPLRSEGFCRVTDGRAVLGRSPSVYPSPVVETAPARTCGRWYSRGSTIDIVSFEKRREACDANRA